VARRREYDRARSTEERHAINQLQKNTLLIGIVNLMNLTINIASCQLIAPS